MERRSFVKHAGLAGIIAVGTAPAVMAQQSVRWRLASSFPNSLDTIYGAANVFAQKVKELTNGYGAHGVCEAVGTQESMDQALASVRPGGYVGFVGVSHDQTIDGLNLFFHEVHLEGGPAPVRRFLPELIKLIQADKIHPGKVFTKRVPLENAAEAYKAMDERREIKVLLAV